MRTRSNRHPSSPDYVPPPAPVFPERPSSPLPSRSRPSRNLARPNPCRRSPLRSRDLSPSLRSDVVLRNVAILAVAGTIALAFLNLFLYLAIFAVGLLAPAWQTFKALEARDAAAAKPKPVQVIEVTEDGSQESDDDDWVPESLKRAAAAERRARREEELRSRREEELRVEKSENEEALRNWQAYWVMAGLLFASDGVLRPILGSMLPRALYGAGLFSAVTWLTRNRGGNAAAVYAAVVRPMFLKSEVAVDKAVDKMMKQMDVVSRQAVVGVNQVVAPYARQLEHAAAETGRQLQEQAHGRFARQFRRGRFLR